MPSPWSRPPPDIVVVGGLGKTTRDAARGAAQAVLTCSNKQPIGVIVNFAEPERGKYSHYYRPDLAGQRRIA